MKAMKKSGSAVFLMELILVILFFSLSAVVTLRLFVAAHQQERQSTLRSDALELAENAAELFRAQGVSFFDTADGWTAVEQADESVLYSRLENGLCMEVILRGEQTETGRLETGEIQVFAANRQSDPLCRLPLGRYSPGEAAS